MLENAEKYQQNMDDIANISSQLDVDL